MDVVVVDRRRVMLGVQNKGKECIGSMVTQDRVCCFEGGLVLVRGVMKVTLRVRCS